MKGASVTFDGMTVESNHATEEQIRTSIGAPDKAAPVETPKVETPVAEAQADPDDADDADVDPASEAGKTLAKRKQKYSARIGELTGKWRTTERERDAAKAETARLKAEIEAIRTGKPAVEAPSPSGSAKAQPSQYDGLDPKDPKPTIDQFADSDDPYRDHLLATFKWEQRRDTRVSQHEARTSQDRTEFETRAKSWADRRDAFAASTPDFHEKAGAFLDTLFAGTPIGDTVMDSAVGPHLALHLATHPQELARISAMHWRDQLRALGKLEDKLEAVPPAAADRGTSAVGPVGTTAKPIPKPLGGSPVASDESEASDDLSVDEHIRRENAKEAKARRR